MAVKIKLKRLGKMRNPQYRIVVADARTKRDGRAIEEIGMYHPKEDPSLIEVDSERAQYWLSVGAQPTEAVAAILKVTGDWQKFKGLPGAEGTLRVAEPEGRQEGDLRGRRQGELRRRQGHGDDPRRRPPRPNEGPAAKTAEASRRRGRRPPSRRAGATAASEVRGRRDRGRARRGRRAARGRAPRLTRRG